VPSGSIGKAVANTAFSVNLEVRIAYATPPCGATGTTLTFPLQWVRGQSLPHLSVAKLPPGSTLTSPTSVQLRGLVDMDGAYRFPTLADGPAELTATAVVTAAQWKFQPYRVNGVGIPQVVLMPLSFTTSGMPEPIPAPTGTAPVPPGLTPGMPPVVTSSTIGGRSSIDFTTDNVAGLTAANSLCEMASDRGYGLKPDMAVQVGGGLGQGPSRELQYLRALRGPAGQGLHIVRLGAAVGADGTILDLYQVTYPGLEKPIQIVLDEYHEGPLKAVSGLVCATSIK
jgi:hypothetical protein